MEMKKIYISGKITNNANYKADFEAAELALKIAGFQPVNPAEEKLPDGATIKKPVYNAEYRREQYITREKPSKTKGIRRPAPRGN